MTLLLVFLSVWLCLRWLLPLFAPFLLGTALALAAEPMVGFLCRRLRLPRPLSAALGVCMAFGFLTVVLLLLCAFLVRELGALSGMLPDLEAAARSGITMAESWLLELSSHTPPSIRPLLRSNVSSLFSDGTALVGRAAGYLVGLAGNLLSHIPDSALGLGTGVVSAFLISAKLPRIRRSLLRHIPRERLQALLAAGKRIRRTLGSWLLAQVKLTGITLGILFLGFVLLRIPYAPVWALGVCLVDAFPILGTGTVLLPWSLLRFLQGDSPRAMGLLGIYVTVTLTRSLLEPKLVGRHLGLDPLATLMALYAGYKLWGIAGMFLAPMLTVAALQLVPDRKSEE